MDDRRVDNGEHVYITAHRSYDNNNGEMKWHIDTITRHEDGYMIENNPGEQQMVIDTVVKTDSRCINLENVEVVERYPIRKPKDELKEMFCRLWDLGWDDYRISPRKGRTVTVPDGPSEDVRLPEPDDFKVTTVNSRDKDAHLGIATSTGYLYKLGMKWKAWHNYDPTKKLFILSHELVHCRFHHHRGSFYREHARFIRNISSSPSNRETASHIVGGEINWNELKSYVLDSVEDNREIAARDDRLAVRDEMEEIMDFPYKYAESLYLRPPVDALTEEWLHDPDEFTTREDMRPDDVVEMPLTDVEFPDEHTDEELVDHLYSFKRDFDHYHKYVFGADAVPVVDEDGTVVENRLFAQLYQQLYRTEIDLNTWTGEISDEKIPVRVA